jgi:hypothetical protein
MLDRDYILSEIKRTAKGGRAVGRATFAAETGIRDTQWNRYWARWNDAVAEAGFGPNSMQGAYSDDLLLESLADETRRLGRFPTSRDLKVRHTAEPAFPDSKVFQNRWRRAEQIERLVAMCSAREDLADVLAVVKPLIDTQVAAAGPQRAAPVEYGQVYMARAGHFYKVGRTNAFGRREYELAIQLPERAETVHIIRTDDPAGIEAYWHRRFADRRRNGEWFALSPEDVAAFKRRKFM